MLTTIFESTSISLDGSLSVTAAPQFPPLAGEEVLQMLVANESVVLCVTDNTGRAVVCEGEALFFWGIKPAEVLERFIWEIYSHSEIFKARLYQCLAGDDVSWISPTNGGLCEHNATPLRDEKGTIIGAMIVVAQVSQSRLMFEFYQDSLTGLYNRVGFLQKLKEDLPWDNCQIENDKSSGFPAIIVLDVDRFKAINDSLGHNNGDLFLKTVALRLKQSSPGAYLARLDGDEFAIYLREAASLQAVLELANQIQQQLRKPVFLAGYEVCVSVTMGVVFVDESYCATGLSMTVDLLRDAGLALCHAQKRSWSLVVFEPAMRRQAVSKWQLEAHLRRCLMEVQDNNTFILHYQPIIDLKEQKICGFEALVRWRHPQRGLISPAEFIPIAEESGLILPLGLWVLEAACRQLLAWQEKYPQAESLTMSVNLSCQQLLQRDLKDKIESILNKVGCNPSCVKLEITESSLQEDSHQVFEKLQDIKTLGVQFALDDFGTGYSSLSRLYRFPIQTLKIDRSFVTGMDVVPGNTEIVRTIIALADNLGMEVTAEGIETKEQLARLQELGCNFGQGFLFSRPVECTKAEELLTVM